MIVVRYDLSHSIVAHSRFWTSYARINCQKSQNNIIS